MSSTHLHITDFTTLPGSLIDQTTWEFPAQESVNANSKPITWKIYVRLAVANSNPLVFIPILPEYFNSKPIIHNAGTIYGWTNVDSGLVGGKVKKTVPTLTRTGKNLGKSSATNVLTQALRDAYGIYNKHSKKSARGGDMIPAMLAQSGQTWQSQKCVFVQRKYNGVRMLCTLKKNDDAQPPTLITYSRHKNVYLGFDYLVPELTHILGTMPYAIHLDGEAYKHGVPLQDISGHARREEGKDDLRCDYLLYDCYVPSQPGLKYSERYVLLEQLLAGKELQYTHLVPTEKICVDASQQPQQPPITLAAKVQIVYEQYLHEGYEGAMVRFDGEYVLSYNERRSRNLIKIKPVQDGEYAIVGWETGTKGKAAAALMIRCNVEPIDREFNVTPAMDLSDREALAKKMAEIEPNNKTHFENHWLGKKIIVYYDEISKDGVPQRGRTKMEVRTWD